MCVLFAQHLRECYNCRESVIEAVRKSDTALAGSVKTEKKAKSSRENGKLGGRPKKS